MVNTICYQQVCTKKPSITYVDGTIVLQLLMKWYSSSLEWAYGSTAGAQNDLIYYGEEIRKPDKYSLQNPYSLVIKNIVPSDSGKLTFRK